MIGVIFRTACFWLGACAVVWVSRHHSEATAVAAAVIGVLFAMAERQFEGDGLADEGLDASSLKIAELRAAIRIVDAYEAAGLPRRSLAEWLELAAEDIERGWGRVKEQGEAPAGESGQVVADNRLAVEPILRMVHLYRGYRVGSRGPTGCAYDCLDVIAPDIAERLRAGNWETWAAIHDEISSSLGEHCEVVK